MKQDYSYDEFLVLTSFCMMACDGHIDQSEIEYVNKLKKEISELKEFQIDDFLIVLLEQLNKKKDLFLRQYLRLAKKMEFSQVQVIQILKIAISTMEADNNIEYNEIRFFKELRSKFQLSSEEILKNIPHIEEYLKEDVITTALDHHYNYYSINDDLSLKLPEIEEGI